MIVFKQLKLTLHKGICVLNLRLCEKTLEPRTKTDRAFYERRAKRLSNTVLEAFGL